MEINNANRSGYLFGGFRKPLTIDNIIIPKIEL